MAGIGTVIIAEIGINHNGSVETAIDLINAAKRAGADIVKFQKKEPRLCVPRDQWDKDKETPWGTMSYISYKERLEFEEEEYDIIAEHCQSIDMPWTASAWDIPSVDFLISYDVPYIKVASASLTNDELITYIRNTDVPSILSTGMSTPQQIIHAVDILDPTVIMHCNSSYPCPVEDINLRCIYWLHKQFPGLALGFSDHSTGLATSVAAVSMGATFIERHITLNRASWGTDHAASVEPGGFARMVKDIRNVEKALGDGHKRITAGEIPVMEKLRGAKVKA
jgi:N-acetylneuraminate synthase